MINHQAEESQVVVRVGVQMIVKRGDEILLGRRKNAFQAGTWGLPGGHVEINESLMEAAARELKEETGLIAIEMHLFCVTDPLPASNHHMQIGIEVLVYAGEPEIKEPEKCDNLSFHPLHKLPEQLFISSVGVINNYRSGRFYAGNNP